jgi:hypothetical protein
MANDSKRVSELSIATSLANTDRVVVLTDPSGSANVKTITLGNLGSSLAANGFPIANSTQLGVFKVGDGLSIAANGVLTAPLPVANTSAYGVVKIGNNLSVNATGFLSATSQAVNTGNIYFTDNLISANNKDILISAENSHIVSIASNNAVQIVFTGDGYPYGNGANQTYVWVQNDYTAMYAESYDATANVQVNFERDHYANGAIAHYGSFSNNTTSVNYSYTVSPNFDYDGYAVDIQPSTVFGNKLSIYPTADYDIHLFESGSNGAITLGNYNETTFRVYGPGGSNNGGGQYGNDIRAYLVSNAGFYLSTNNENYTWKFNSEGAIIAPTQSSNARTGTGQVLKLGDNNNQLVIVGASTNSTNQTAARLVIAGADGTDTGEGGDIYLWAGQSGANGGTGGDIKVDAGNANNSEGGTIKIRGGSSNSATGGFIEIRSGAGSVGAPIDLYTWSNTTNDWHNINFSANGDLTIPAALRFKSPADNTDPVYIVKNDVDNNLTVVELYIGDDGTSQINSHYPTNGSTDYFAIMSTNVGLHHLFGSDGSYRNAGGVYFADDTVQNTAFQKVAAPAHSDSSGSVGQIAWDSDYLYICTATDTWKRIALDATGW